MKKPKNHFQIGVSVLLKERGYTPEEIKYGISVFNFLKYVTDDRYTSKDIFSYAKYIGTHIKLRRDMCYVGSDFYQGEAYFWAYRYRFWMRGDAHGNGYKGIAIERARKLIHAKFLAEGLELGGETARHDEIINSVFDMDEYTNHKDMYS